ncbi:hypothetical protein, partial [Kitasatospora sp. NPDC057198]|uniref:hypothetical protein n=1 Tax=Kitasatospora sp. NPDC057198 TaxID=3346046 RepID=UPI0036308665
RDLLGRATTRRDNLDTAKIQHTHGLILLDLGRAAEARAVWSSALTELGSADHKIVAELRGLLATG